MPSDIVVAYDFSAPAERALELARVLRAQLKAAVHVVYVHEVPHGLIAGPEVVAPSDDYLAKCDAGLRKAISDAFGPESQAVSSRVLVGAPVATLLEFVRSERGDLLLLGTTGKSGVTRVLLGSVAEKLVRTSPVPVLTVH